MARPEIRTRVIIQSYVDGSLVDSYEYGDVPDILQLTDEKVREVALRVSDGFEKDAVRLHYPKSKRELGSRYELEIIDVAGD